MKWITLKAKNLPIVALEIDRAIEVFSGTNKHYLRTGLEHGKWGKHQRQTISQSAGRRIQNQNITT